MEPSCSFSSTCSRSTRSPSSTSRWPIVEGSSRDRRPSNEVFVSPQFDDGAALLAAARDQELEGVVAKKTDSPYKPGRRSTDWHKLKLRRTQEVVIAGYTRGQGRRTGGFGALVVGVHDAGVLRWAGNVGTGFSDSEIDAAAGTARAARALRLAVRRGRRRCRACVGPTSPGSSPKLVAEVEFAEWTHEGRLRSPTYLRVREDKPAADVRRERAPLPAVVKLRGTRAPALATSTSRSGPTRGSPRATLSRTTATSPRLSSRTCAAGRSR